MKKQYKTLRDITQNVTVCLGAFDYIETAFESPSEAMAEAERLAKSPVNKAAAHPLMQEFVDACIRCSAFD